MEADRPGNPYEQAIADALAQVLRDGPATPEVKAQRLVRAGFPVQLAASIVHMPADAIAFACVLLEGSVCDADEAARAITAPGCDANDTTA